jgi:hypothetical protein
MLLGACLLWPASAGASSTVHQLVAGVTPGGKTSGFSSEAAGW